MTKEPLISVYIVNKNYGKYLDQAIKSVINQTFKSKEIIIIDDNSTDNSKQIIEKYKKRKLCKVIYNKTSKGLIKSSNIAIKMAIGTYVIRLDADDYFDANALAIFFENIKNNKSIALVYSDYYLVDSNNNILSLEKQFLRKSKGLQHLPVLAACCLIRKSALISVNFYDEKFSRQDGFDIWYKLINNFQFNYVSLPLFYYRRHENNLTKNTSKLYRTRTKILNKFSQLKKIKGKIKITCIIPVRGKKVDLNCNSLELLNGQPLIYHTINEALKIKELNKIIITTSDEFLLKKLKKKYKKKIFFHKRKEILSSINISFKESVIQAINKFEKRQPDLIAILTYENPLRKKHYIEQAISNSIIHKSDLVIGTVPDIDNNYYKFSSNGIKLLSNQKNIKLRLERKIIHKEVGAFAIYRYLSYRDDNIKKITNVIIDLNDSFVINNKRDLQILNKIKKTISMPK